MQKIIYLPSDDLKNFESSIQNLTCSLENTATHACTNKQCKLPGLTCSKTDCKCQQGHYQCHLILLKRITGGVLNKNLPSKIEKILENFLSLKEKFQKENQYFGLNKSDLQFIEFVKTQKYLNISGKLIYQMQKTMKLQNQFTLKLRQNIVKNLKKQNQLFQELYNSINKEQDNQSKKYLILNTKTKNISFEDEKSKQIKQNTLIFQFVSINVNKETQQFKNNSYLFQNPTQNNICQRILATGVWKQVVSIEQLPEQGAFFVEINILNSIDNTIMIGLIRKDLIESVYNHDDYRSLNYYASNGNRYPNNSPNIGKAFSNSYRGLMSILIDLNNKEVHWLLDRQYIGKQMLPESLINKKLHVAVQTNKINAAFEFMNQIRC